MLRPFFLPLLPCLWLVAALPLPVLAQYDLKTGEWKSYASFATGVCGAGSADVIFVSTTGGLLRYTLATGEVRAFSRLDGLSEVSPATAWYHEASGNMFLGYASGTIDVMSPDAQITAISDIARNDFYTSKGINAITGDADRLFVATDFGMVIFDVQTLLPQFTVAQFGTEASKLSVGAVAVFADRVWAAVSNKGLYSASLTFPNLSDPAAWRKENGRDNLPAGVVHALAVAGNRLYAGCADVLRYREGNSAWVSSPEAAFEVKILSAWNNTVSLTAGGAVKIFDAAGNYSERYFEGGVMNAIFPATDATYFANVFGGLVRTSRTSTAIESLIPDGPASPNCRRTVAANGKLYVLPGGDVGTDYSGVYFYRRPQGWKQLTRGNGLHPDRNAANYARGWYDSETDEVWAGSWGVGLSVIKDSAYTAFYDCNNAPDGISRAYSFCDSTSLDNSRVSGIGRDSRGHTWLSFSYGIPPLSCLAKEGTWYTFLPGYSSVDMRDLVVDEFDTKWLLYSKNGLVAFNDKGTLTNTADDAVLQLTSGSGRGNLPSNNVSALALDRDGYLWVGTDAGVAVFYDTYSLSQGKVADASLPVFEGRELFRYETVNAIAVDGGNRKWFGTNSGLFLLGPDGTTLQAKYTTENSPLPSNEILSLSIDHSTAEIFIGTSKGLVSLRGESTAAATTCDGLSVFPNPAYREENEVITIRGTLENALVRITDMAGGLVRELQAKGGTAVWDGFDAWGNRAQPGLYMALAQAPDGTGACVTSFSVLK